MKGSLFYAKILLFGEYGIIKNSKGLSIPYNYYQGALKIPTSKENYKESHESLKEFVEYLKSISDPLVDFDWKRIQEDLDNNLYFDSSIPKGYGIGSSGALVAAFYDKYAIEKITVLENLTPEKLKYLKDIFAQMESFFHGTSSGLDPLNSYLSLPILIDSNKLIQATGIPSQNANSKGAIFLLDSGQTGETAPMVQLFFDAMKNEPFRKMMKDKFINYTETCIDNFLDANFNELIKNIKKLSLLVIQNFKPMIPKNFHDLWLKGIESNTYYLKLCGSGGGGYILGFTKNIEKTKELLKKHQLEIVYHI